MTLQEIKTAVENGKTVCWATRSYRVIKDNLGRWLILCGFNCNCTGLTWVDGVTLNGAEKDFFIVE